MELLRRIGYLVRRRERDADLSEELAFHESLKRQELEDRGLAPSEARFASRRAMGSSSLAAGQVRDVWMPIWLQGLGSDVRFAARALRSTPLVTIVALLTLAVGIGANTAIFSFVKGILLAPLPYPHADRLVSLWEQTPSGARSSMSVLTYQDYAQSGLFERAAAATGCCGPAILDTGSGPMSVFGLRVSASYFDVFEAHTALGRTFAPGEDQPGHDRVVVLTHKLWATRFDADPAAIGRSIRLNGEPYIVIGVMPENSPFNRSLVQLWRPLSFPPERMNRSSHWLISLTGAAVGRLKPGISVEGARSELQAIAARLGVDYPQTNADWGVAVEPYAAIVVRTETKALLFLLWSAVGLVLLIGCVNLASLMLARGAARNREVALRMALGASRAQLIRQLLTESAVLSGTGGLLGIGLAFGMIGGLKAALLGQVINPSMALNWIPPEAVVDVDWRVLLFTIAASGLAGVAFGLVPAMRSTRPTVSDAVGLHGQAWVRATPRRLHRALIVAELALAFTLLMGAGLLMRSFLKMRGVDTGFSGANVLTASLPIWEHRFSSGEELRRYQRRIVAAIESLPGVQQVALTDGLPLQGVPTGRAFQILGRPVLEWARRPACDLKVVSPAYFQAMSLRLRAGRTLSEADRAEAPPVAVINETMARMHFSGVDPIGQHVLMQETKQGTSEEIAWAIVGVITDERLTPFADRRERPALYVSIDQLPTMFANQLLVRTHGSPERFREPIRRTLAAVDKDQAIADMRTVEQLEAEALEPEWLRTSLLATFAFVALLLAAIGVYGVFAYAVVQRTHELGIRSALGARRDVLIWTTVREGIGLAVAGLALGIPGAWGATQLIRTWLFGIGPADLTTMAAAAGCLALVAVAACYVPARRVNRIDVVSALKAE
jgi:putative ABC transport system permease protein